MSRFPGRAQDRIRLMRPHFPLAAICLIFLVACGLFASSTPYRTAGVLRHQGGAPAGDIGAPDERQHANYIIHVKEGKGFPVLKPGSEDLYETYQAHQPPLYYLLMSVVPGDLASPDGGFAARMVSALFGIATILGVFFAVLWGSGRQEWGLAAAAFGLMPMHVALCSAISNDPMLYAICTWTLALLALVLRDGINWKLALGVGALIGAGMLTKTTAIALLPTAALAAYLSMRSAEKKPIVPALAALAIPLLIAGPWLLRNQGLYGDPLALNAFKEAFVGSPQASDFIREVGASTYWLNFVMWWTLRSLIGVFGYMDIFLFEAAGMETSNLAYLVLIVTLFALAFLGDLAWLKPREDEETPEHQSKFFWVLGVFFVVVLILFLRFNAQYFQGQGRYLYPAFVALAAVWGAGTAWMFKGRAAWAWTAPLALLALLNLVALQGMKQQFKSRVALGTAQATLIER